MLLIAMTAQKWAIGLTRRRYDADIGQAGFSSLYRTGHHLGATAVAYLPRWTPTRP